MEILSVKNLKKHYPQFDLKDVSFSLEQGYIMGFIGSNGAGKTTTLKSMLGMVHKDSGTVSMLGMDFAQHELEIKQHIGFMFGGVDYYAKTKIRTITDVVRRFYHEWDDSIYQKYMKRFALDDNKRPSELSSGMRIKYSLVLALSHRAKLLLLDEPTSGLDPVARDNLLELFQEFIEDGERSILFSTHITSDLEKCADYITYIERGCIIESRTKDDLLQAYRLVKGTSEQLAPLQARLIASKSHAYGFSGLIKTAELDPGDRLEIEEPTLEDIMIYYAKKEGLNE
ncbi:MAG: ABC transporter ATP-binding protein [Chloroflexi bacterium HGW-Chloroflexi-4]|jgi:ABC-2 type transport system ATP-binding protein|nr:MAG: ABC transporter ATP-binding protein [Chloroflexi bacterium HGW-Chloroflexi-4]